MPVIETNFAATGSREKDLYEGLIAELKNPSPSGQPLIEIRQMNRGGLKHVHVIWDKWEGCAPETRAAIIRDTFTAVKGIEYEKSIAITVAATVPEAVEAGLLPFEVRPIGAHRLTKDEAEEAREAMMSEGASTLVSARAYGGMYGGLPTLAFATPEQGEEVVRRLQRRAPKFIWGVVVTGYAAPGQPR